MDADYQKMRDEIKQMNKAIKKTDFDNLYERQDFINNQRNKLAKTHNLTSQNCKLLLE